MSAATPEKTSNAIRQRSEEDQENDERSAKRVKREPDEEISESMDVEPTNSTTDANEFTVESLLPPSRSLLGLPPVSKVPPDGFMHRTCEVDVGISQYVGSGLPRIEGIIKQRFTDFMVFEIDMTHNVAHITSLDRPTATLEPETENVDVPSESDEPWPDSFNSQLSPYLSEALIGDLKTLFLEGAEPPNVEAAEGGEANPTKDGIEDGKHKGKRGGKKGKAKKDHRQVSSGPISSKETRTAFHKIIRELFKGKLETFTDDAGSEDLGGSRIIIKWAGSRDSRGFRRAPNDRAHQPYIHFTLQKTNRDTSDALSYLSRILKVDTKCLSVAGTKDKRGVTTQRVCLKRGRITVEEVWDKMNFQARKSRDQAVSERGERGIRVADITYRKGNLQLGMLKGNEFLITLRNVKAESQQIIDTALEVLKTKGFINYYGMQRFGTASVPTHAIGLALLQSDWARAVELIMRPRPGEPAEVEEARRAWMERQDLDIALRLIPRRMVAERCLLESFQKMKGDNRNLLGAISTIPRNLRMMYIHAYQSYVWNAVVSERIKKFGIDSPVAGDIVYEEPALEEDEEEAQDSKVNSGRKSTSRGERKPTRRVKVLQEEELHKYTIFDVLMPLPGTDAAYPGGALGDLYREFLILDGLDPSDFSRKQKEYSLAGSYRKILNLPKNVSWSLLRYTDPDLPLAQSDEDRILGLDVPQTDETGRFVALQIRFQLGTACYATMALREVTKVDTSSHVQTALTATSEDQAFRGMGNGEGEADTSEIVVDDDIEV